MYNLKSSRGVVDATEKVWSILCVHTTSIVVLYLHTPVFRFQVSTGAVILFTRAPDPVRLSVRQHRQKFPLLEFARPICSVDVEELYVVDAASLHHGTLLFISPSQIDTP
jgi:hypothetical protein